MTVQKLASPSAAKMNADENARAKAKVMVMPLVEELAKVISDRDAFDSEASAIAAQRDRYKDALDTLVGYSRAWAQILNRSADDNPVTRRQAFFDWQSELASATTLLLEGASTDA